MPDRFYVPGVWTEHIELDGTEAHHLAKVLRAEPGDTVELFNGTGQSATAEVTEVKKRTVQLKLMSGSRNSEVRTPELVIAVASPKGDRLRWMIEKMTELGVDRFIPLKTTRSVVDPSDSKLSKLEQTVIGACKQCRRDRLLQIDDICQFKQLPTHFTGKRTQLLFGEANAPTLPAAPADQITPDVIVAIIGPEGGFTPEEQQQLLDWNAVPVSLSPFVLRVETAAVAFATHLQSYRT
ncbi:RsmE family RNA methyltransferase [Planctomicrobium sp. SH527]|uniref:RsmE family RNA methyltransferase n=1 Tax=Planctomicrobium sp. SH527 TaxID=3448123 RepID=UPI003F5B07EC